MPSTTDSATVLAGWLAELDASPLILREDGAPDPGPNLHIFPFSVLSQASPDEISEFLEDAYRSSCRHQLDRGWFYAWFDEMSGTLRTSLATAEDPSGLPFTCDLHVVDAPLPVAELACASQYLHGIPWAEFEMAPPPEGEQSQPSYRLTIFARALRASAVEPAKGPPSDEDAP